MKKDIDLGKLIDCSKMYYNYNSLSKEKSNSKTLQHQDVDNVQSPSATTAFQQEPSEEEEKRNNVCGLLVGNGSANQPISTVPGYIRLNPNALYDRICIQIANVREQGRYARCNVYVSLKEDTSQDFNVFLTGAATRSHSEVYRGCQNSPTVEETVKAMIDQFPDIMIARLRYKSINGFITDFHRKLTKSAVIGIIKEDDTYVAILSLYQEFFRIPLDLPLSRKQLKIYVAHGIYEKPLQEDTEEL